MNRRSLLASAGCALPAVAAGCLSGLDGTDDGSNDQTNLDCGRFEGMFGLLTVGVPEVVPDDVTVFDLEETGILEYDVVEAEMENAREQRSEAEERIGEYGEAGEMAQTGSVQLGNGERYEDVEAALEEYEPIESEHLGPMWHVTYRGDVYGLSLGSNPLPIPLGDVSGDESRPGWSATLEIHPVESVPDDADAIDAAEEELDDGEYLGELLTIAGCSDDLEEIPYQTGEIARSHVPVDRAEELRETLDESRRTDEIPASGSGWYLEYGGEVYALILTIGAP